MVAGVRHLLPWILLVWPLLVSEAHADAQRSLRAGIHHAEQADFAAALGAFAAAASGDGLARADLARLYAHRAVVRFAVGDRDGMEADLAKLLALSPKASLPKAAPPPVRDALRRVRDRGVSRPKLSAHPVRSGDGLRLMARVQGGPEGLVTRVRVCARIRGTERWACGDRRVPILSGPGVQIEWYVEAHGAGGAVLARLGSAERPRVARGGAS
jgi:hypothetical protein